MKKLIFTLVQSSIALLTHAQVTALYGNGTSGYRTSGNAADSVNCAFTAPYGASYDSKGNLWITDQGNNFIVMIYANNKTYQLREGYTLGGFTDGASVGQFGGVTYAPSGIVVVRGKTSANDQIYICDAGNNAIRKVDSFINPGYAQYMHTLSGGGTKVQGLPGQSGYVNGTAKKSLFKTPAGIGYIKDASGGYLVVADMGNNAIRKVSLHKADSGTTSDINTTIQGPQGIFIDYSNNIYVASPLNNQGIMKVSSTTGSATTVVPGMYLGGPSSLVIRRTDMYIADGCRIMDFDMTKPASASNPSVYAGNVPDTLCDFRDGSNKSAWFNGIALMTISPDSSYLVVADQGNNRFRKVMLPTLHTVGVENAVAPAGSFNVYPNPASGHISINSNISGNSVISLFTITGKQVMSKAVMMNANEPYELVLGNQPAGVYVLQISSAGGVSTQKIMLQ